MDCNALTVDIDNEVVLVHNFIRDKCVLAARRCGGKAPDASVVGIAQSFRSSSRSCFTPSTTRAS